MMKKGKLYIVGTPIGNLSDISKRAVATLKSVDYIACEDTRHTLPLLNHLGISKKLFAYHKFNENEIKEKFLALLSDGSSVALVSDAGMPSVCDPGSVIISLCHSEGIEVEVVPSATAVTSALSLAGYDASKFVFLGFLPQKESEKKSLLADYQNLKIPTVIYSAPHDLIANAQALYSVYGDRKAAAVKEITKIHEGVEFTTLADFKVAPPKGEYVLIVEGAVEAENPLNSLGIKEHVLAYMRLGEDKKEAIKKAAKDRGLTKNEVYQLAIDLKDEI